jgi:hypothetical protein
VWSKYPARKEWNIPNRTSDASKMSWRFQNISPSKEEAGDSIGGL